jgi:zinc D-Ala-D-Ala dipeptidase
MKWLLILIFSGVAFAQVLPEDTLLVDVQKINPRIKVEIRYATENNFTGKKLYSVGKCFLRKFVAVKLDSVQKELENYGLV